LGSATQAAFKEVAITKLFMRIQQGFYLEVGVQKFLKIYYPPILAHFSVFKDPVVKNAFQATFHNHCLFRLFLLTAASQILYQDFLYLICLVEERVTAELFIN
jgi:hypothetical protein